MVIVDMAARISKDIRVVTLDTGRLPAETFDMIETVRARYGYRRDRLPGCCGTGTMVASYGPNLFYESVPLPNSVLPFSQSATAEQKLTEFDAWLTGLRRIADRTPARSGKDFKRNGRTKISPLADGPAKTWKTYTIEHDVPRHPLYAKGYTSIGCAPCSRATEAGRRRAGGTLVVGIGDAKECGMHFTPDGRAMRTVDVLIHEILDSSNAA